MIGLFVLGLMTAHEHQSFCRHQELKHAQDSAIARNQYVIDYHFGYCDFTPKENFKPYYHE